MAIKKSEFVPDAPLPPPMPPYMPPQVINRGPDIPIYMEGDIPLGPGGGRADAGGAGGSDLVNLGNNPFIVSQRGRDLLQQEIDAAAEEAARIATEQAVVACTPPG